jgi:hypothetical protein
LIIQALLGPGAVAVLVLNIALIVMALRWLAQGRGALSQLKGGASALRGVISDLTERHPLLQRLSASPTADISFEEIAAVMDGAPKDAARSLMLLRHRIGWIDRFAQIAIHLGILGTVTALILSDPSRLDEFRANLPLALGTTFWGLAAALTLSWVGGAAEDVVEEAEQEVRMGLLGSLSKKG